MGILKQAAAALTAAAMLLCSAAVLPVSAADTVIYSSLIGLPFANGDPFKGVDVSSVISLEKSGVKFRGRSGKEQDIFRTLADAGVNTVRVRIWNDPYETGTHANYGGGICDITVAEQIAKRCANAGLRLFVDFHYSDFWADPGKQKAPKAWKDYSVAQKAEAIHSFTLASLKRLAETGAEIAMVQIGNETTTGMCGVMLADYNWSDAGWSDLCTLFNAGAGAVREFNPDTLVALHFTNPEKSDNMAYLAKMVAQNHVDYDVFATSYYPYWHGTLSNLTRVLTGISQTYHKKVLVAETSWVHTLDDADHFANTIGSRDKMGEYVSYDISADGQTAFLHDLFQAVAAVPDGNGIGVFYWEPAWLPVGTDYDQNSRIWEENGSGWASRAAGEYDDSAKQYHGGSCVENEALFSENGAPLSSLYVFGTVHGNGSSQPAADENNLLQNAGFEADGGWTDRPQSWRLNPTADGHFDVRAEDARSGGYALHWYSEHPFSDSSASAAVTVSEAGLYRFSVHIQGDIESVYTLSAAASGGKQDKCTGRCTGWADWQTPSVIVRAAAGETVQLSVTVSGKDGSYGSVDDCSFVRCTEESGDLNSDGVIDRADLSILYAHLLTQQPLTQEQTSAADLNGNGVISAADAALLKQLLL
ncbi:MAG: glycosyl hydrolase 53 family protein [Oscillospiraceae bacterium]|nr:glycosyl hydrolase 53 family protein [Oscillospiraceae bacterium]